MQNAAFVARALDWAYVPLDVEPERLAAAVRGLVALDFAGANVTIPHKTAVIAHCDEVDEAAKRAGSVNTLVIREGRVHAASTDGLAVVEAIDVDGARVLVLGAGGAAKAAAAAVRSAGADSVVLASRRDGPWPPDASNADVIVNATPVVDDVLVELRAEHRVVDLAYRRDGTPTALVAAGRALGCTVVDGLEILVRQGAASFERWTGVRAPVDAMRAALTSAA
jgi:shikimate dehydrogenase